MPSLLVIISSCSCTPLSFCRIIGNFAAGAAPRSKLPIADIFEPVANFQLCSWNDSAFTVAAYCQNLTVEGNIAAGSSHFGFLLQVSCLCQIMLEM